MNIVLFDGDCGTCNYFVKFLLHMDTKEKLNYASLQSEFVSKNNIRVPMRNGDYETIVFLNTDTQKYYLYSSAIIRCLNVACDTSFFNVLLIFPRFIRDFLYKLYAKNRKLFIKDQCILLPLNKKKLFLD